ncbi:MAG: peroxiredoxin family protein [Candidatus Hydrothermarchaeaceae archaeon]
MVEIGEKAPGFTLKDIGGNEIKLSSLIGKAYVLLVFYRGSWCPICNTQIANFSRDYQKFKKMNTEIVAISSDSVKGAKMTEEKSRPQFPILLDTDSEVIESYGILVKKRELKDIPALMHRKRDYAMPSVFIVDKNGIIRYKYAGKSFTDRPSNEDLLWNLEKLD